MNLKKYWWIILLVILLIVLIYPKKCGYWDVLSEKNCKCYGVLKSDNQGQAEGWNNLCYGICTSSCTCKEGIDVDNRDVVSCN